MCKEFGVLPYEGGLYQQPYGHLLRMEAVLDAQLQVENAERRKHEAKQRLEERAKQATVPAEDLAET